MEYPSNWSKIIKLVKQRDRYTCKRCHKQFPANSPCLQVHHILPLSRGGTNEPSNLITLCTACHTSKHGHLQDKYNIYRCKKPLRR